MEREIKVLRTFVSAANHCLNARSSVILYNLSFIIPAVYTLKEQIFLALNKRIPNLGLFCCDMKDVSRIRAGPVEKKRIQWKFVALIIDLTLY